MKNFDVIVVGGGVIGASIACELSADNLRVLILDRQQPGREASWAAAGMLSPGPDSPEALPLVPLGKESLGLYHGFVAAIEEASGLTVGFVREGAFEVFAGPDNLHQRAAFLAEYARFGLNAESVTISSARAVEPALNPQTACAAWLPDEATVDPRLLIEAALAAAKNRGVEISAGRVVSQIFAENGQCIGILADDQKISAPNVVIAAGSFCAGIGETESSGSVEVARYAPTYPVRGQMMALRSSAVTLKKVLRSSRGYLVPRADGRIVAGSTLEPVGFTKGTTPQGLKSIFDAACELAPELAGAEIVEQWSGLRPGSPDHLPIIGPTDVKGLFIATGHYRNGVLLAPVTARLIRDWVVEGKTNFAAEDFSPLRFATPAFQARNATRSRASS
ncbi:MAG TPA: glycine oxidase ThiO [Candidatus Acidoferrales bacterium]